MHEDFVSPFDYPFDFDQNDRLSSQLVIELTVFYLVIELVEITINKIRT